MAKRKSAARTNWKTTLAGLLGAAASVALPMIANGGQVQWSTVGVSAGLAAIGWLAKDGEKGE